MVNRIWCGPEKEGFEKGVLTAFIEAEHISDTDLDLIAKIAKEAHITRLYFGANERDLLSAPKNFAKKLFGFDFLIETSLNGLFTALKVAKKGERIILRQWIELPTEQMLGIQFKIRNESDILVFKDWAHTSTAEIKDGIYITEDKLLYEDGKQG